MVTVKINDKASGSKQLINHLHTLKFVEFTESDNADAEFEELEKYCITGDELMKKVYAHIDKLFDTKELVTI